MTLSFYLVDSDYDISEAEATRPSIRVPVVCLLDKLRKASYRRGPFRCSSCLSSKSSHSSGVRFFTVFNSQQTSLEDYIETSIVLQYNY